MQYNNQHTDKKLQELENQSLPDLSKMDDHWEKMTLLLQPGTGSLITGKIISRKKILITFLVMAAVLIVSFFVYRNTNQEKKSLSTENEIALNNTLPGKTITPVDSPMLLKARTSDGRDTILKAVPVNQSSGQENNKLLLEKFYEQLQKKPQRFLINNQRDTIINGKEGTRLYIPANSFDIPGNFTLRLSEFYSISDMITHKLTTSCDGHRLVTGGMIYLDARNEKGDFVDLNTGASLRLDIPKQDNQQPMELFYGYDYYRNDVTEVMDSINWQRTNQPFTNAKANPEKSFLVINKSEEITRRDSLRILEMDGEPYRRTFDYVVKDTAQGKPGITIKGDSILLQKFGVNINRLGWINCDKFYNDTRPRTELIVDLGDNPDNYNTLLVFDKPASIMPASSKKGNTIRFLNLPEGETARIIVLGIKNGKPVTAMQQVTISKTPVSNMNFEEITASAYKNKLNQ